MTGAISSVLRPLLIEAAQSYTRGRIGHKSVTLKARQYGNPTEVITYADKANLTPAAGILPWGQPQIRGKLLGVSETFEISDFHKGRKRLKKVKQQILAFCLRHNYRYDATKSHWTQAHLKWLRSLKPEGLYQEVLAEYACELVV